MIEMIDADGKPFDVFGEFSHETTKNYLYDKAGNLLSSDVKKTANGTITREGQGNITLPTTEYYVRGSVYLYNGDRIRTNKYTLKEDANLDDTYTDAVETQYFYFDLNAPVHG